MHLIQTGPGHSRVRRNHLSQTPKRKPARVGVRETHGEGVYGHRELIGRSTADSRNRVVDCAQPEGPQDQRLAAGCRVGRADKSPACVHDHRHTGIGGHSKSGTQKNASLIARVNHMNAIGNRVYDDLGNHRATFANTQGRLCGGLRIQLVGDLNGQGSSRCTRSGRRASSLLNSPDLQLDRDWTLDKIDRDTSDFRWETVVGNWENGSWNSGEDSENGDGHHLAGRGGNRAGGNSVAKPSHGNLSLPRRQRATSRKHERKASKCSLEHSSETLPMGKTLRCAMSTFSGRC